MPVIPKPEKPKTLVAFLPSNGYSPRAKRATLHKYLEMRETVMRDSDGRPAKDGEAYEYIFVCTETGAERRWGIINRYQPKWLKDGN